LEGKLSEQVGNRIIDTSFVLCTVLMFIFVSSWTIGVLSFGTMTFLLQLIVGMWVIVLVAFILSRAQINRNGTKGMNSKLDDAQAPSLEKSSGSSFVIPSYCPYCHAPIILEDAYWVDEGKLVCPECNNSILVRVVEDI
jgi:hypothetical protein